MCIAVLLTLAQPLAAQDASDAQTSIDTAALTRRLRQLFTSPPVRTNEFLDALLTGPYEPDFGRSTRQGVEQRRVGTTRTGLPVSLDISRFPDGAGEVVLALGPTHVLSIEDIGGVVYAARLYWIDNQGQPKSQRIYDDAGAAGQSRRAWATYRSRLSLERPELPPLGLKERDRQPFLALYEADAERVFGTFCGYAGVAPDDRVAQVRLLREHNVTALRYILRAQSVVSRLYAAEALLVLQRDGYRLKQKDAALIERLKDEPQTIEVCSGEENKTVRAGDAFRYFTLQHLNEFVRRFGKLGDLD